jgi:putative glutamine amidotransferase
MRIPRIGVTCHAYHDPMARSAVGQQYIEAIVAAGGAPIALPIGLSGAALDAVYGVLDGLLLPGGDDVSPERYGRSPHPQLGAVDDSRDELELAVATRALEDDLPILGICRGVQVLAVAAGGTLYQDIPSEIEAFLGHDVREHGRDHLCHELLIQPGSRLAQVLGTTTSQVNSFHHQSVDDVPEGFVVSAWAGDQVIEAIEAPDHRYVIGVQCHPEGMWRTSAPEFSGLFRSFVEAARYLVTDPVREAAVS